MKRLALMRLAFILVFGLSTGVFPCICAQNAHARVAVSECCHPAEAAASAEGAALDSHHQCCGMQRAPIAIERTAVPASPSLETIVVLSTVTTVPGHDRAAVIVPNFFHGPPSQNPLYLTTQRFLI